MADTKLLTITLGAGNFIFEVLEALKTYYAKGETVKVHYKCKNNGNVAAQGTIVVKDADTNTEVTKYYFDYIEPGYSIETVEPHATVGTMPDKDWNLEFTVSP